MKETREIYRKIKQDWEQKYATGVQWQIIAEQAIQQQIDRLRLDKELQQKKAESKDKRPTVVSPPDLGEEKHAHLGKVTKRLLLRRKQIKQKGLGDLINLELQTKNKWIGNDKKQ